LKIREAALSSILLARHGPVALPAPRFPTCREFKDYVDAYERSGIRSDARPPEGLIRWVREAGTVFTSPSPRAGESLKLLHPERIPIIDPVFAEEPHIIPNLAGRWPLLVWFSLERGWGRFHPGETRSRGAMRLRADKATNLLIAAAERGPVVLIGHGWFNQAIAFALSQKDWGRAETCGGSGTFGRVVATWGHVVYRPRGADDEPVA
jgi:hypothetical protein